MRFSAKTNPSVMKNVKSKKSVRENRNSLAVSPILEICLTPSSSDAAMRYPPTHATSGRISVGILKCSRMSSYMTRQSEKSPAWRSTVFLRNPRMNTEPRLVTPQTIPARRVNIPMIAPI